jgi:GNAT superfamily N-acetyltransferase
VVRLTAGRAEGAPSRVRAGPTGSPTYARGVTASHARTIQDPLTVRETRAGDVPAVVRLHLTHLPHGLFPRLGRAFMARWHRTFLATSHGVSLVVVDGGDRVVGFLAGATAQRTHVRTVIAEHRLPLAVAGLAALAVRPGVAVHFLRTRAGSYLRRLVRPRPSRTDATPQTTGDGSGADVAVVTALVVDPVVRGRGAGARLVDRFVELAAAGPAQRAELITLDGTDGARRFYEGLGWTLAGTRANRDGQQCLRMERALPVSTTVGEAAGRAAGTRDA